VIAHGLIGDFEQATMEIPQRHPRRPLLVTLRNEQDMRYQEAVKGVGGAYAHFKHTPHGYVTWGLQRHATNLNSAEMEIRVDAEGVSIHLPPDQVVAYWLSGAIERAVVHSSRRLLAGVSSRALDIFSLEGTAVPIVS